MCDRLPDLSHALKPTGSLLGRTPVLSMFAINRLARRQLAQFAQRKDPR